MHENITMQCEVFSGKTIQGGVHVPLQGVIMREGVVANSAEGPQKLVFITVV